MSGWAILLLIAITALVAWGAVIAPILRANLRSHSDEWRAERILEWVQRPLPESTCQNWYETLKSEDFQPLEGFAYPHTARQNLNRYLTGKISTEEFIDYFDREEERARRKAEIEP